MNKKSVSIIAITSIIIILGGLAIVPAVDNAEALSDGIKNKVKEKIDRAIKKIKDRLGNGGSGGGGGCGLCG